jgi:predicted nucleic acid-binding protein
MIVVADTTPLCHLAWIGADGVLAALFGEVHVPEMVMVELQAAGAPESVRAWANRPPVWLKIHPNAAETDRLAEFTTIDAGERAALALALELSASLVVADDRAARSAAVELGFVITGTLSILERAARTQLLDFEESIVKLRATGFWVRETIIEEIRQRLRATQR